MATSIDASKTHKLYLILRHTIVAGDLNHGDRLPSEPELGARHKVSRVTVRRALEQLEKDGLIIRQPGAGTFVTRENMERPVRADFTDALAQLGHMGRSTGVRLLAFDYILPGEMIAQALQVKPGERVQRSIRVRTRDGEPFSYLVTYVPEEIGARYSESDLASTPLLTLLETSGVVVDGASQTLSATLAAPDIAEALEIDVGAPLLTLQRLVTDVAGRHVEYLQAFYRPDLHAFHMELVRAGDHHQRRWGSRDAATPPAAKSAKPKRMSRAKTSGQ